jgi:rod shape-determining protein MreC
VLTAGGDLVFPRGMPVGVVEKVVRDPERDSFIDVIVTPAAHLDRIDEVLVITSTQPRFSPQQQQDLATSEALKGSEAAAIKEQKKASEVMAERLPGLTDPKLPPDQQPLLDNSNPNPVAHPPQALHPDRFTPGAASGPAPATVPDSSAASKPEAGSKPSQQKPGQEKETTPDSGTTRPVPKTTPRPASSPGRQTTPRQAQPQQTQPQKDEPRRNP